MKNVQQKDRQTKIITEPEVRTVVAKPCCPARPPTEQGADVAVSAVLLRSYDLSCAAPCRTTHVRRLGSFSPSGELQQG